MPDNPMVSITSLEANSAFRAGLFLKAINHTIALTPELKSYQRARLVHELLVAPLLRDENGNSRSVWPQDAQTLVLRFPKHACSA